jgi:PST family polysaccharide transporter/lipopolysaccharide exporter
MTRGEVAKNISRGAFFLGLEKVIANGSTILYSALIARWLGPTKYGMFSLAFAIVGLATVLTGNFETFLERYAAEYQVQGRFQRLAAAHRIALAFKLGFGLLASAALIAASGGFAAHFAMPELNMLLPLLVIFIATDGLATTGRAMLFGLQRYEWVSGFSLVFNVGKTILVGALWYMRQGLVSLALGLSILTALQAVIMTIGAFLALEQARRASNVPEPPAPEGEKALLPSMIGYCLPLYGANAAFLSGQNLPKLILAKVLDATQLGYFSFAFQTLSRIVELVYTIPTSLLPSLTQLVAREERDRLQDIFTQAFRIIQTIACVVAFGLFVFAPEIVRLVGSPLFEPAVPLLRVLALVPIVRTAQQPLTMLFQAMRRPGLVLTLAVLKVSTEIACYLVLLKPLGAMGACWANLGGAAVSFAAAMVLLSGVLPEGHRERVAATVRSLLWLVPGALLALLAERQWGLAHSLPVRAFLLLPAFLGIFALGLVNRYDLVKLASVPLPGALLNRVRASLVAFADQLARMFEPRRVP